MLKARRRWLSKLGMVKAGARKITGEVMPTNNCDVVTGEELAVVVASNVAVPSCSRTSHSDEPDVRKRIWNRAYEQVLNEDPKLVQRYEKIIEKLSGGSNRENALQPVSADVSETGDRPHRWDLMEQSIKIGLKRTETEAKAKGRMEQMMSSIQSVTELIERSVHACHEVAFVWAGVCFAMEVIIAVKSRKWHTDHIIDSNQPSRGVRSATERTRVYQLKNGLVLALIHHSFVR
jgi:hypothetical protein